ncbi:MAG TPA: hypothetical protein VGX94_18420 [Terriglobia bacterium]|nr:hypothetical protein [Terriglobia bacterium]
MRKIYSMLGIAAMMLFVFSLPAAARQKKASWTGWISDSSCGVKGMSAAHKACALTCVHQKGASFVFVTEDKTVHPISNQSAVKDADVGEEVSVTGRLLKDGSIDVQHISPVS